MATGVMLAATYLLTRPTPTAQLGPALDETVTRAGPLDETVTWPGH